MPAGERIYSLDLMHKGSPALFAFRTMEEIDAALGGIEDKPHRHNYYTVIWPFSATGRHIIDFKEYIIERDKLFFVSPWQVHQVITDRRPTGYVILFTPGFLEKNSIKTDFISNLKLFRNIDETPPLDVSGPMAEKLRVFATNMHEAFNAGDDMSMEIIGAYLKLFLIECNGHCSLNIDTNLQRIEVSKSLVKGFKELVEKNFSKWHQVQDYAVTLSVTPNYLNEVIRSSVGMSAKDYIQHRITLEAKRMVVYTGKSGKEIGFDLGFDDPAHFSKFFRTNTGISLIEFRETLS